MSAATANVKEPGPVEKKLRAEGAAFKAPEGVDPSSLKPAQPGKKQYRFVAAFRAH